ncbi:MAG: hypothetical protein BWY52_01131 [Chloroflexi bacterium ADurb.Bin325]|nr:MAG: hypothetical protein BWY52_01131 [Chloroflexi bacterium ADurb.Bin325]
MNSPANSDMLLPEMTMMWLAPVRWKASFSSAGMPLSMPRRMPLASAAAGSGRRRFNSAKPSARTR